MRPFWPPAGDFLYAQKVTKTKDCVLATHYPRADALEGEFQVLHTWGTFFPTPFLLTAPSTPASPLTGEVARRAGGGDQARAQPLHRARFRLAARYFLLVQKVPKDTLRGENPVRLRPPRAGPRSQDFPPENPRFYGSAGQEGAPFPVRRVVNRHTLRPLSAAAPSALAETDPAHGQRLAGQGLLRFLTGSGNLYSKLQPLVK